MVRCVRLSALVMIRVIGRFMQKTLVGPRIGVWSVRFRVGSCSRWGLWTMLSMFGTVCILVAPTLMI